MMVIRKYLKLLAILIILNSITIQVAALQTSDERDRNKGNNLFSPAYVSLPLGSSSHSSSLKNVSGSQRTLAILVEFTDVKHSSSEMELGQLIFANMSDYWEEVSYGKISIVGRAIGWCSLGNAIAYYGADSDGEIDDYDGDGLTDSWRLIRDAVKLVDDAIDFKGYDHIIIVHAGNGQESNPEVTNNIWSVFFHEISIPTKDGVHVTSGIIVPEAELPGGIRSALGVLAHEFGHSLGLADLYMYTHRDVETLGDWSLMDHGEWLGVPPGSCPAHLEAWGKMQLGWITPLVVQPNGQIMFISALESKADLPKAVRIQLTDDTYYLIEVRQKVGFDSCLPREGVLVTYINEGRKSGEGIVRVLDSNPQTIELNDAAFQVGDMFQDDVNHVYIRVYSRDKSSYQVVLSRRPIVLAKLSAPNEISASYHDEVEFPVYLANSEGKPLPHMIVLFEYGKGEEWTDLGRSVTDGSGFAFLKTTIDLRPGSYMLRYIFAGGELGDLYYVSNSTLSTLTVAKKRITLLYDAPSEVTAFDQIALRIYTLSTDKKPISNVPIRVYLDQEIYKQEESNKQGFIPVTLKFSLFDLGAHKIRVEITENDFYEKSASEYVMSVQLPGWLWILVLISSTLLIFIIIAVSSKKLLKS